MSDRIPLSAAVLRCEMIPLDPSRLSYWMNLLSSRPDLKRGAIPRLNRYIPHTPTPKQSAFLLMNPLLEGFYGGAARGGKTDALLMGALQYCDLPGYNALILRRTYGQLNMPDSILTRAHQWLRNTDARWNAKHNRFDFPSGAMLQFGYLQYFKDVYQYDGSSFHFIGFDELTQFLESQYRFLFSRLSKAADDPIPLRMRSASNPGGLGHLWVRDRLVRGREKSRFYIPANLVDNPHINQEAYRKSLSNLDLITRKQREFGDWDVAREGALFKREWFTEFVDTPPASCRWFRFWDFAATAPKPGKDPDFTAGTLLGKDRTGRFYVNDVQRFRLTPQKVEARIYQTAKMDGPTVRIRMEQEPGASGKSLISYYIRLLAGWDCSGLSSTGPKITRWMPVATQAEAGNLVLVNGPWNEDWFEEMCAVPESDHDDQADSLAGAFNCHVQEPPNVFGVSHVGSGRPQ